MVLIIRVNLPPNESSLPFQDWSFLSLQLEKPSLLSLSWSRKLSSQEVLQKTDSGAHEVRCQLISSFQSLSSNLWKIHMNSGDNTCANCSTSIRYGSRRLDFLCYILVPLILWIFIFSWKLFFSVEIRLIPFRILNVDIGDYFFPSITRRILQSNTLGRRRLTPLVLMNVM